MASTGRSPNHQGGAGEKTSTLGLDLGGWDPRGAAMHPFCCPFWSCESKEWPSMGLRWRHLRVEAQRWSRPRVFFLVCLIMIARQPSFGLLKDVESTALFQALLPGHCRTRCQLYCRFDWSYLVSAFGQDTTYELADEPHGGLAAALISSTGLLAD